jgi:F0F1-type ATP synthase assembly protein I
MKLQGWRSVLEKITGFLICSVGGFLISFYTVSGIQWLLSERFTSKELWIATLATLWGFKAGVEYVLKSLDTDARNARAEKLKVRLDELRKL